MDEIYEMDLNDLLIKAKVKDIEQYGKEDYRTDGVNILKKHFQILLLLCLAHIQHYIIVMH